MSGETRGALRVSRWNRKSRSAEQSISMDRSMSRVFDLGERVWRHGGEPSVRPPAPPTVVTVVPGLTSRSPGCDC